MASRSSHVKDIHRIPEDQLDEFKSTSVAALKSTLKARGLSNTGTKVFLWLRLTKDMAKDAKEEDGGEEEEVEEYDDDEEENGINQIAEDELDVYNSASVAALRAELKARGPSPEGSKASLWLRLVGAIEAEQGSSEDEDDDEGDESDEDDYYEDGHKEDDDGYEDDDQEEGNDDNEESDDDNEESDDDNEENDDDNEERDDDNEEGPRPPLSSSPPSLISLSSPSPSSGGAGVLVPSRPPTHFRDVLDEFRY